MGVIFIVSIGIKLSKKLQCSLKLLTAILWKSQQKIYCENIDKTFPSLIAEGKISLVLLPIFTFPKIKSLEITA